MCGPPDGAGLNSSSQHGQWSPSRLIDAFANCGRDTTQTVLNFAVVAFFLNESKHIECLREKRDPDVSFPCNYPSIWFHLLLERF